MAKCDSFPCFACLFLVDGQLEFGSLVSTSNTFDGSDVDAVTIKIDTAILWTMGVK